MTYWPFWVGGFALAAAPLLNYLLLRRMMAVSGRVTALVDAFSATEEEREGNEMSPEELALALREAAAEEFGEEALEAQGEPTAAPAGLRASNHLLFFAALTVGGFLSAALAGELSLTPLLRGELFEGLASLAPGAGFGLLFGGGLLVGAGTRMAGGCTSGHGLCGVSRLQTGSLVATASFFGVGIVTALLLGGMLG